MAAGTSADDLLVINLQHHGEGADVVARLTLIAARYVVSWFTRSGCSVVTRSAVTRDAVVAEARHAPEGCTVTTDTIGICG